MADVLREKRDNYFLEFIFREQFVEEMLRSLINGHVLLISKQLEIHNETFQPYMEKPLKNMALGQLISEYKKYNTDNEFNLKLKSLKEKRNIIVHSEFLERVEEQKSVGHLTIRKAKLAEASELADNCFKELLKRNNVITKKIDEKLI